MRLDLREWPLVRWLRAAKSEPAKANVLCDSLQLENRLGCCVKGRRGPPERIPHPQFGAEFFSESQSANSLFATIPGRTLTSFSARKSATRRVFITSVSPRFEAAPT